MRAVTKEVSKPISKTINFLKVCTMTLFIVNLIPELGGIGPGEGAGGGGQKTRSSELLLEE